MHETILVIEDNEDIRENIAEILDLGGYKTVTAENGKKGIELALNERPSLIICDIMMPELDGYGVLHVLRRHDSTQLTPFIFLTAKTERDDFRKGMQMGADDYITKPFEDVEVLNAVETRLKKSALLQQSFAPTFEGLSKFLHDAKDHKLANQLSGKYETLQYARKQILFSEGRHPRYLYYLVKGKVKTSRLHEDGKEYITDLYNQGDFVGYTTLLEETVYNETATVLETAEILHIPKEDFRQMVFGDTQVACTFIHLIAHNIKEKEERLLQLAYSSLRKRIAKALVDIALKFKLKENEEAIEISREEFAQYVGTATESLIRTLSDFKAEGHIGIKNGKIVIHSLASLENLLY